ncbi:MAG: phosphoribosylamine--glycine ligase [Deltaproteobacteria bacterium]|nr:phosphoribosylamine--glycine ligase [Deltaproteobacteria bacterium]
MGRVALVLGGGGREHALAWALSRSASVDEVLVAPGNAGTTALASEGQAAIRSVPIAGLKPEPVLALAREHQVGLVVVGPEAPLCDGVVDALDEAGITAFGPSAAAAQLEGSKAFLKRFATRHDIPTAAYTIVTDFGAAEQAIDRSKTPVVVKADGLAGGKGAIVTRTADEAKAAARSMLVDGVFGEAGKTVIIEERLTGREMSVHVLTDGERMWVLPVSRDHKRVGDGDTGPNTGGMGAFAPIPVPGDLMARIEQQVLRPTISGMAKDGSPYRGVLYAGLMIAPDGTPNLLEHNVRFGDPETQVLMPMIDGDVAELFASVGRGSLDASAVTVPTGRHVITIVLAAGGYPQSPRKGDVITGLEAAGALPGAHIFHAGTAQQDGQLVTSGGRVLGVGASGSSAAEARATAYRACELVTFEGMHYRSDIATTTTD